MLTILISLVVLFREDLVVLTTSSRSISTCSVFSVIYLFFGLVSDDSVNLVVVVFSQPNS